jgi:hypothetical protein
MLTNILIIITFDNIIQRYGKEKDYNRGRTSYSRSYRRFIAWDISQYHRTTGKASRNKRQPLKVENMQEVLDEIYEKCIAETNLREFAQAHLNSDGLPN